MKATLDANGQITIPKQIQAADHLAPRDSFELERVAPGRHFLAKRPATDKRFTVVEGDDGLPVSGSSSTDPLPPPSCD